MVIDNTRLKVGLFVCFYSFIAGVLNIYCVMACAACKACWVEASFCFGKAGLMIGIPYPSGISSGRVLCREYTDIYLFIFVIKSSVK